MYSRACLPLLPLLCLGLVATALSAFGLEHAVAGTVTKVDSKAKTIVVKKRFSSSPGIRQCMPPKAVLKWRRKVRWTPTWPARKAHT